MNNFFKKYGISVLLVIVIIFILLYKQRVKEEWINRISELEKVNKQLTNKNKIFLAKIDSLSKVDKEIVKDIQIIKVKEYEKIVAVDTMSISDLQNFFTERYGLE